LDILAPLFVCGWDVGVWWVVAIGLVCMVVYGIGCGGGGAVILSILLCGGMWYGHAIDCGR